MYFKRDEVAELTGYPYQMHDLTNYMIIQPWKG